jgi:Zn-dependent protease
LLENLNFALVLKQLLVSAPGILFGLTIHEFAHGWAADKMGDPTARLAGRLTLNPLAHLDPIGTLLLFIAHFGWAKPVPINPLRFKEPRKGIIIVSSAGALANIICALVFGLVIRVAFPVAQWYAQAFSTDWIMPSLLVRILFMMSVYAMFFNLILAIFNLIPIPPLDGSHILFGLLRPKTAQKLVWLERYGPMILIGLIIIGSFTGFSIFGYIILPPVSWGSYLFSGHQIGLLFAFVNLFLGGGGF